MSKSVVTTELLKSSRCVLGTIVCYEFAWNPMFLEDGLLVCNNFRLLDASKLFYHRKLAVVVNDSSMSQMTRSIYAEALS